MSNVGFPDNQRGIVSPQLLLADPLGSTDTVTVTIPKNAEGLVIFIPPGVNNSAVVSIVGVTTGIDYPFASLVPTTLGYAAVTYCPIAQSVDAQVLITLSSNPLLRWYVVADNGIRQVVDMALQNTLAVPGGIVPNVGVLVGGNSGGDFVDLEVDSKGRIIPLSATLTVSAINTTASLIAAPVSSSWALLGGDLSFTAASPCVVTLTGHTSGKFLGLLDAQVGGDHADFNRLEVSEAIDATFSAVGVSRLILRYTAIPT